MSFFALYDILELDPNPETPIAHFDQRKTKEGKKGSKTETLVLKAKKESREKLDGELRVRVCHPQPSIYSFFTLSSALGFLRKESAQKPACPNKIKLCKYENTLNPFRVLGMSDGGSRRKLDDIYG